MHRSMPVCGCLRHEHGAHLTSFPTKKELKKCTRGRSPPFRHRVSRSCVVGAPDVG